jgi:alpha-methylacyl-CoA racemase
MAQDAAIGLPVDGSHACYNIYKTADDRYLALGALEPKFWEAFCERIGRPDLVPLQYVEDVQRRILRDVCALMRTRTRDEWVAFFAGVDACLTPVNSVDEALSDPQVVARGAVTHRGGSMYLTTPIRITAGSGDEHHAKPVGIRAAPALGAHTDDVLEAAGIDAAARADLRARGVI